MGRRVIVDLFCEDAGHEAFARALVARLAADAGRPSPVVRARNARGGHGRAVSELKAWLRWDTRVHQDHGDVLFAMVDANGDGWALRHAELAAAAPELRYAAVALAAPDPHVEAWCAADPAAMSSVLGATLPPLPAPGKTRFKRWLREALESAGHVVLSDPMDISAELVPELDLYRAGKACPSLRRCVDDLQRALSIGYGLGER